jgi:hypothetical protein
MQTQDFVQCLFSSRMLLYSLFASAPTPPRAMGATRSRTAVQKDPPGAPSASRKRGQVRPHYRSLVKIFLMAHLLVAVALFMF